MAKAKPKASEPLPETPKLEISTKTPGRIGRWLGRLRQWYINAGWKRRTAFITAIVTMLVIIVIGVLIAYLSFKALTGDDLSLFLKTSQESIALQHGEQANISFTLSARNLAFCTATCDWSITDKAANIVVASGTEAVETGIHSAHAATITAPNSGRYTKPYQVITSCHNTITNLCRSSGEVKQAVAITLVNITDTPMEAQARASLEQQLPLWVVATSTTYQNFAGIAALNDTRILYVQTASIIDQAALQQQYSQLKAAVSADDASSAISLLTVPHSQSLQQYTEARQQEQVLANQYSSLKTNEEMLNALLAITNATDTAKLVDSIALAETAANNFSTQPLLTTAASFDNLQQTLSTLNLEYEPIAIATATRASQLLTEEMTVACTIKNASCPAQPIITANLTAAVSQLGEACTSLKKLNTTFSLASQSYEATHNPADYPVAAATAETTFNSTQAAFLLAARNGTLVDDNITLRLAVQLEPASQTKAFIAANCTLNNQKAQLTAQPQATLPLQPSASVQLEPIVLEQQQCCSLNTCTACTQQNRYPVIFVHGHSFTDNTAPEENLNAFTSMAIRLQNDGYLYLGHVFPREDLNNIAYGEYSGLPAGLSATATYYYDSYPEAGQTTFVIQKSENIETYAIRLKEAINVAKHKTGSSKVILVAHSMGGLVARRYLQIFGDQDTAALIMIGTPNNGITGRTATLCPLFGGKNECDDMIAGSLFMNKLNNGQQPSIPVFTIAGSGCDNKPYDGVVDVGTVQLSYATNYVVNGTCLDNSHLLHSTMLKPDLHPDVYQDVKTVLDRYTK